MCIFFVLPVFKCSVSCGTGIQVRNIDCVIPALANGSHIDYLHSQNDDGNNSDNKNDRIDALSDAPTNGLIDKSVQMQSNEQISMECDPKMKPIATQSCTTGIECTTIINDYIGRSNHEEDDKITNASNEEDNENENDSDNENGSSTSIENDNENINSETDNNEGPEEVNVDQNPYEASVEAANERAEEDLDSNVENASAETNIGTESEELDEVVLISQWISYPFRNRCQ